MDAPPPALKPIKPYLDQAKARAAEPVVAYHCRLFALQEAMAMRAKIPKEDMGYILKLMDSLEVEKKGIEDMGDDAGAICETAAHELFQKADDADRAGKYSGPTGLQTAKDFLAAAQVFEVCKQFGELPADIQEKIKYGKWRYVEICKAAKEKRAPAPPRGLDLNEGSGGGGAAEGSSSAVAPPVATAATYAGPPDGTAYFTPPDAGGAAPSYLDLPASTPTAAAASPPYVAGGSAGSFNAPAAPSHAPPTAAVPVGYTKPPPGFKPDRNAIMEAARLSQSAASSLQFQNIDTAVASLQKAIMLLTMPQAPQTDDDAAP